MVTAVVETEMMMMVILKMYRIDDDGHIEGIVI